MPRAGGGSPSQEAGSRSAGALDRSTLDGSPLGPAERLIARTMIAEGDYRDWAAIDAWPASIAREVARVPARRPEARPGLSQGSRPRAGIPDIG